MHKFLKSSNFWLLVILFVAAIFRFYELEPYLRFLGDEGRDALVVKRMIVDHDLTLLGPTASVGGFYIGALYYYFMAPFLWLFNLNPVGPAVMSALFGIGTVALLYFFSRTFFGTRAALIAAFLCAVSPKMIEISRFSWNPNPVPFFTLTTVLFLYLASKGKTIFVLLSGISLGVMLELHFINLAFVPIAIVLLFLMVPRDKFLSRLGFLVLGVIVGNFLFFLMEIRNQFLNTKSIVEFVTRDGKTIAPRSLNPLQLTNDITRITYEIVFGFRGRLMNLVYLGSLGSFVFWLFKAKHAKAFVMFGWLVMGTIGVGLYQGRLLDHYFSYLYPLPLMLVAFGLSKFLKSRLLSPLFIISVAAILYFSSPNYYFWNPPNRMLEQTQEVARIVLELAGNEQYNFALITPGNSDHAYRYFLEVWKREPLMIENPQVDPERKTVTRQLIVVCEQADCAPRGYSSWEVAGFGRAEIVTQRQGPAGIKVYKLLHYTGS